jgi:hypothetical protein
MNGKKNYFSKMTDQNMIFQKNERFHIIEFKCFSRQLYCCNTINWDGVNMKRILIGFICWVPVLIFVFILVVVVNEKAGQMWITIISVAMGIITLFYSSHLAIGRFHST